MDDGSKSLEESVEMLKIAKKQGVKGIILTPHLRHGMFKHPLDKIERHYKKLLPYAKKLGIELTAISRVVWNTIGDGHTVLT